MTYNLAQVYLVQNLIRGHDKMIVKIGVSEDTLDRIKSLQTGNAFKIEEIASFDAGREAFKHERYLHNKFKKYHRYGEWFEFDEDFFFSDVLPQCEEYFENVEALEGRPYTTNRTLKSLLSDVDEELENVNLNRGDVYVNHKLAQINLQKAQLLADDDKQVQKYQKVIDDIQEAIDRNKEEQRRIDQEKLAIKMMKYKAREAQKNLDIFAMGYLVGCASR